MSEVDLSFDHVSALLSYDSDSGDFRWKIRVGHVAPGSIAGHLDQQGYRKIKIGSRDYFAHRLAWLLINKEWPDKSIDHINRCRSDNRIYNLRLADKSQNSINASHKGSYTGIKGVYYDKKNRTWMARIAFRRKRRTMGPFRTAEDAGTAYTKAAQELHGEYVCTDTKIRDFRQRVAELPDG